jgi:hypothetical protein
MTPEFTAASAKWPLGELDSAWSTCPTTLRRARLLELPGWAFYVAGRGGVLGDDARVETVAAAIGTIAVDAVRSGWEAAKKVGPGAVAAARLNECVRWGDEKLSRLRGLDRLGDLLELVVAAADATALPLFGATRALPWPDARPGGRVALRVHLLHEHRAGALLLATRACGLSAVEALVGGPEGEPEAAAFGWQPPFPARTQLLRRYAYAEAIADRIAGQAYTAIGTAERAELVGLLVAAAQMVRAEQP